MLVQRERERERERESAEEKTKSDVSPFFFSLKKSCVESGGVRPFGVSLLIAGFDSHGPQLYQADPSGTYFAWKASAIGKNMTDAKEFLEKRYNEDMELEDAIHAALLTLKEGYEGKMDENNIEVGISTESGFRVLGASEVRDYLEEII